VQLLQTNNVYIVCKLRFTPLHYTDQQYINELLFQ